MKESLRKLLELSENLSALMVKSLHICGLMILTGAVYSLDLSDSTLLPFSGVATPPNMSN
jgi:hypothetical protein